MAKIYPKNFIPAKICYNCYSLFDFYCIRRQTRPTNASIHKYGCDAFFIPINPKKGHNCFNCKFFRKNYCITNKKVINNLDGTCPEFAVVPHFVKHPSGLAIRTKIPSASKE